MVTSLLQASARPSLAMMHKLSAKRLHGISKPLPFASSCKLTEANLQAKLRRGCTGVCVCRITGPLKLDSHNSPLCSSPLPLMLCT